MLSKRKTSYKVSKWEMIRLTFHTFNMLMETLIFSNHKSSFLENWRLFQSMFENTSCLDINLNVSGKSALIELNISKEKRL